MVADKKHARKQHKKKLLIEQQRQRVEDVDEDEALDNKDLMRVVKPKEDRNWSDKDSESENDEDLENEKPLVSDSDSDRDFFENPLAAMKAAQDRKDNAKKGNRRDSDISDDWSSDEEDRKAKLAQEETTQQLGKKRKRSKKDNDNA
jgi:hypothetical protein